MKRFQETAQVQKAQKKCTYTISPIKNIELWREEQKANEIEWQKAQDKCRAERREKAQAIVRMDAGAKPLTDLEVAEIDYRRSRTESNEESARRCQRLYGTPIQARSTWEELQANHAPTAPKGLYDRFKTFVSNIWTNANFSR